MTDEGYEALKSDHIFWNYAWKYNDAPKDNKEENAKFENFIDVIEDSIIDYDTEIVQAEVNEIYDNANEISEELKKEFENASDVIEEKITEATDEVVTELLNKLTEEEKITLYMQGASDKEYFDYALAKQNKNMNELIADKLGTTAEDLQAFIDAVESLEEKMNSMNLSKEAPLISLDEGAKSSIGTLNLYTLYSLNILYTFIKPGIDFAQNGVISNTLLSTFPDLYKK